MTTGTIPNQTTEVLTKTQRQVHTFIQDFFKQQGYSPTAKEIADGIGIKSRGVIHRYLKALAQAGLIQLIPNRHRNIRLNNNFKQLQPFPRQLPVIGSVLEDGTMEVIEHHQSVDVANIFLAANRFALRVKGDGMTTDGILDGDILVCEHEDNVRNEQNVVVLIDQQKLAVRKIRYNPDKTITLFSANSQMHPITYPTEKIKIQGVYLGLIRLLSVER